MQMLAQDTSKKVINYMSSDPLFNIFKQLKDDNAKEGDYFRIIDRDMRFAPIYKITSIIEPNIASQQDSLLARKSMYLKESVNQIVITQTKPEKQGANKFRLSFGSQIYLKNAEISKAKVEILRPYFQNLYVWLRAKNKGYIQIREERIVYHQTMQTSSIWVCMLTPNNNNEQVNQKEVVFCNFDDGSFLHLDQSGVFMLCTEQRATKFTLRPRIVSAPNTNYIVQGRNVLSQMIKNKSKQEIKKIIDRNIDKNIQRTNSRRVLETQLEIIPVQDSYVTIQLQLNYSLIALQLQPSLRLIKTIFDELIYYGILQFATDSSLINEHLERLLLQKNIFHSICSYLLKFVQESRKDTQRFSQIMIKSPKKKSSVIISNELKSFERVSECVSVEIEGRQKPQIEQNQQLIDLLSKISVICKRNHFISQIFEPFLNLLIQYEYFQLGSILLNSNQYFISKFHKMGWYNLLYKKLLKLSKNKICKIIGFLCKFCENQSMTDPTSSNFTYRQLPSTNNQYLIYNSIKNGQYYSKIFQFQMYSEGIYVFLHNLKSDKDKDVQFHTFIQGVQGQEGQRQVQSLQHMLIKQQTSREPFTHQQNLLLSQLTFLKAVSSNYNCNIFINHWPIVYALAPYCYRDFGPHLQNPTAKKAIINLVIACDVVNKESTIFSKNTISYIITKGVEDSKRILAEEVGDFKNQLSQFIKDFRKKAQTSRKIIKEMGNYFLKVSKINFQLLKQKQLKVAQIYENSEDKCLVEWLRLMYVYFLKRSIKVKQKKQGQLISYIKKFFESVQKQKKSDESQQNLITFFIQYLLQLLNFNLKYDSHLSNVKVKRNYEGKLTNQINKVISNFQSKKQVFFSRRQKSFTKIEFINIIYKGIQKQSQRQEMQKVQKNTLPIKILVSHLLQLILQTVKEESVDQSVQTLNYLIKNSSDMSSVSSFSLLQMTNKFPMETRLKQVVLEQWYFASNCKYFNQLTSLLRLLYYKKLDFKASINEVFLFDKPQLLKIFHNLIYPAKFLKKFTACCQTWLRQSLFDKFDKYGQIYEAVLKYLQIVSLQLQKLNGMGQQLFVSKLVQNLNILKTLASLAQYISTFYIQKEKSKAKDPRQFNLSSESFFDNKLNLLTNYILKIISSYLISNEAIKLRQAKLFLHIYGQQFSQTYYFSQLLLKLFWEAQYLPSQQKLNLMKFLPMGSIAKLCQFLPETWPFIQFYCQFQGEQLVHFVQKLHNVGFKRQQPSLQYIHQIIFISPCDYRAQSQQDLKASFLKELPRYQYMHQIVFFRLVLKLIYSDIQIQFVEWFRDKFYWALIQHQSELSFQKTQKSIQINTFQLQRKRLICELGFEFRHQRAIKAYPGDASSDIVLSQIDHLIIDYLREQIKESRQKLSIPLGHQSVIVLDNINDPLKIQYLEYVVCDLTVLSRQVDFLKDETVLNYLRECRKILKDYYRIRIIEKENDNTPVFIGRVDKILSSFQSHEELTMRRVSNKRTIPLDRKKTDRTQRSKPLKKWDKAVQQLNNQKSLSKYSQLVQDMIEFNNVYEFKSEAQDLSFVVNHQDFFFKLVQSSLNMKRLNLSQENQIFMMEQLYLTAKQKSKNRKQAYEQLIQYAQRLLENISEEQQLDSIEQSNMSYSEWRTNIYVLSLKLQIISICKLFEQRHRKASTYPLLVSMLQMALANYQKDLAFFQLLRATLFSKEERNFCEYYLPFEIVLNIISEQITFEGMFEYELSFCTEIFKAFLMITTQNESEFVRYTSSDIVKMIEKMEKEVVYEIHNELKSSAYFIYLLALKN